MKQSKEPREASLPSLAARIRRARELACRRNQKLRRRAGEQAAASEAETTPAAPPVRTLASDRSKQTT
jgi:hypothetical protein